MRLDDVIARLTASGLADKEARAFAHLTHLGQSKVADLAKAAGLKRAETYQILERLQARGLVEADLSRPRKFTAVGAQRAVRTLVEERANELRAVQGMQDDLTERLDKLSGSAPERSAESFRVLHDRNQITGQLARTLRAAKTEARIVASSRSLFRLLLDEGLEAELLAAHERGIRVRILTDVLPGQEELLPRLAKFADVRHMFVPRPLRFILADEREIVQYVTADPLVPGTKETALWLDARDHVQAQSSFFDDMWSTSMTVQARLEELETGRASEQMQIAHGRFTRYEKQKEMILRAKTSIDALWDAGDAARMGTSGVGRALASRIRDGVRVRVLVPPGVRVDVEGASVREADVTDLLPRVIVDEAEALLVMTGKEAAKDVTALPEYGVWLSLAPTLALLSSAFEKRWAIGSAAAPPAKK